MIVIKKQDKPREEVKFIIFYICCKELSKVKKEGKPREPIAEKLKAEKPKPKPSEKKKRSYDQYQT